MPYRAPNAYARFVKSAGSVNNPGATRIMGLVGTGLNNYEIFNEMITRSFDACYDKLENTTIAEVYSIASDPITLGKDVDDDTTIYSDGIKVTKNGTFDVDSSEIDDTNVVWPDDNAPEDITVTVSQSDVDIEDTEYTIDFENQTISTTTLADGTYDITFEYIVIPYEVKDGFIVWDHENGDVINVVAGDSNSTEFTNQFTINVDDNKEFLLKDKKYKIILNSIEDNGTDPAEAGVLLVDRDTSGILGEYAITVGTAYTDIIPGLSITLNGLLVDSDTSTDESQDVISIENSIMFDTVSGVVSENLAPEDDSAYYVSYRYDKADKDYEPKIFFDYDDIVEEYGNYDVTVTGQVINSLALGAEIAFQNGLGPIICVQAKSEIPFHMKDAIDKLQRNIPGIDNVNTVIPLTTNEDVQSHVVNHINMMSDEDEGRERMVYLGSPQINDVSEYVVKAKEAADSFDNERVVYVVPDGAMKDVRDLRTGRINERFIPSPYVAVAVAALGLRNDPAEPLTNKYITGFNSLNKLFTESEKNFMADAGALVLEQVGNMIRVRHGITTSTNDVNSNEITLIQIKDYVIESCRRITAEEYIGNKNRPSILGDVEYTITSILNQFIAEEIILSYQSLKVSRNKNNPTQIDVRFEIEAVYPLNYINITFGFAAIS